MSIVRATVAQIDNLNRLGLTYWSGFGAIQPASRPYVGDEVSGFHAAPNVGAPVTVLLDEDGYTRGTTGGSDFPQNMVNLNAGESIQVHQNGRKANYLQSNGDTLIFQSRVGDPSVIIKVTATSGRVDITAAGGLYVNGTLIA